MFYRALELYAQGLGLKKIRKKLGEEFGETVSRSTLSYWLRGLHAPDCPTQHIEPSPELSYVIGAISGDGYAYQSGYQKRVVLKARDREFVEEVARCLTVVLKRPG